MNTGQVRAIALGIIRDGERVLLLEGYDPSKRQTFYRPLGGGIEFGERSQETVRRELREEIGVEVTDLEFVATIESVFTFDGLTGHEIALIYTARPADRALTQRAIISGAEPDGTPITAVWRSLDDLHAGGDPLYPEGLLELLLDE